MTNTVQRLEAQGFVRVAADLKDKRSKRISITADVIQAHAAALAAFGPDLKTLEREFGADTFAAAIPFLQRVRAYLDEHR